MMRIRKIRRKKAGGIWGGLAVALIALAFFIVYGPDGQERADDAALQTAEGNLSVAYLDVGQADCILLESEGSFLLIDAGNNEDSELVISYLKSRNVDKLDYVIGTHPHEDHIGSLDEVIKNFPIDLLMMPDKVHTTKTFEDVVAAAEEKQMSITRPVPGDRYRLGSAEITVTAPNGEYGDNLNNYSVGLRVVNGGNTFLFCGDAEAQAEKDMLENGIELRADVLKVSHHGSATSTTDAFLKAVSPSYAVIMCGSGNSYGNPHETTLSKLEEAGVSLFRTDRDGTVTALSDGTDIIWKTEMAVEQ